MPWLSENFKSRCFLPTKRLILFQQKAWKISTPKRVRICPRNTVNVPFSRQKNKINQQKQINARASSTRGVQLQAYLSSYSNKFHAEKTVHQTYIPIFAQPKPKIRSYAQDFTPSENHAHKPNKKPVNINSSEVFRLTWPKIKHMSKY